MKKHKLHTVAPLLSSISKKSGFTVPTNYFEALENNVISKIKVEKLTTEFNKNAFEVPENYFDTVEDVVLTKLKAEILQDNKHSNMPNNYFENVEDTVIAKLKASKKIITLKRISKVMIPIAIAASLLLIFVLNSTQKTVTFESLATAEIEQFIDFGMIDIDTQTLASAFSDIDLETEKFELQLTDNEVLNYLTDEDLETIIYEN